MNPNSFKGAAKALAKIVSKHSPGIFTAIGVASLVGTVAVTFKVSPKLQEAHGICKEERADIMESLPAEDAKREIAWSYVREARELAPLYLPIVGMGVASVSFFLASNKVHADRQAALMAAYSLSEKTLGKYQEKVIEKLGEDAHKEILDETTKEIVSSDIPEGDHVGSLDGKLRVYDNVTGRYFYSTKEQILEAESSVNKRLLNETMVPLQEFYYEMGFEEPFSLGSSVGWDISNMYGGGALNIWFTPMLDDEKNPCLAMNYHVMVFDRTI